ncbi:unnamed protein product [Prunus armeniaca]|uniref:TIR domain-containing protein n=1 Tax=Prunus armeniaca TaxID=36596 RepID=A0A6J5Y5N2_PRUAR|nr:unnamed protein product [Prunus armeniaca]CAB4320721.1 unnamed protein product [Prunus armeniaca]
MEDHYMLGSSEETLRNQGLSEVQIPGTFTSHFKAALGRKKIETYKDDKLGMGDKIGLALLQEIQKSKVRKQQESYADAFAQFEERFEDNMDKVLMWRNALKEAANMSGFDNSKRTGQDGG